MMTTENSGGIDRDQPLAPLRMGRGMAWGVAAPLTAIALLLPDSTALAQQSNGDNGGASDLQALELPQSAAIDLDGQILEDIWQSATPITDFTQQEPVEGGTPSERTEIRVIFDTDHLYIGAIFYDDPDGILAYQRQRDAGLNTDDRFMWILDTFLDGRTGYFFEINPAGLMGDGLLGGGGGRGGGGGGGGVSKAWDGIWEARTARREDGWSAEIRIPFRTLNFNPSLDTWGINFQRTIRRRNEEILWRGFRRNEGLWRPVYAGRLSGLRNLSQGLGLEAQAFRGYDLEERPGERRSDHLPARYQSSTSTTASPPACARRPASTRTSRRWRATRGAST